MNNIPFNKPYIAGSEEKYIHEVIESRQLSGNGRFTNKCHDLFKKLFGFRNCLLTSSCTDALEMCAILLDIQPGDEVIIPSYTFVSTANAFALRGAKIVFIDSSSASPNMNPELLQGLITSRTKAIVVVHYAGIACEMDTILSIASKHNIFVVEDAAQAIDSYYKGKPVGGFGHLAAFSFHETKNIISGEGGMLVINDQQFEGRAEIVWEKGTNRKAFFAGAIDKYGWIDLGSSFLPSEITAAFLFAQLEKLQEIQTLRKAIWKHYQTKLQVLEDSRSGSLPFIPISASLNGHMFYLVCQDNHTRNSLIEYLKSKNISSVFHYQSLHKAAFFKGKHIQQNLPWSDHYSDCLLRLPFYNELTRTDQDHVIKKVIDFFGLRS